MKSFRFVLMALLIFCGIAVQAAQPTMTVAVYDFTANSEMTKDFKSKTNGWNASKWNAWQGTVRDFGQKVTALVTADLSTESNLVMVERAELTKTLNEQALGLSGMINSGAAAKIGQMTGAKVLVCGQIFMTDEEHLTIVANIIGTETSRLYASKVEGSTVNLETLATDLAKKVSETISSQFTNLTIVNESREDRMERIVKAVKGKKRPSVMIDIVDHLAGGRTSPNPDVTTELGLLLQQAGFTVVDERSEQKPDIEITGTDKCDWGTKQGSLFSCRAFVQIKVQERKTGNILAFDQQENQAVDIGKHGAAKTALLNATDNLAERLLPLLAQ